MIRVIKNKKVLRLASFLCIGLFSVGLTTKNITLIPSNYSYSEIELENIDYGLDDELSESARSLFAKLHLERQNKLSNKKLSKKEQLKYNQLVAFISSEINIYQPSEDTVSLASHIVDISMAEKADPIYVAAMIASESSFRLKAKSHVGASGLMQLMPATAKFVAKKLKLPNTRLRLHEPKLNILLGVNYIQQLERSYSGNKHKALAAYNWGPGNVQKAHRAGRRYPQSVKNYAKKILDRTASWQRKFNSSRNNIS